MGKLVGAIVGSTAICVFIYAGIRMDEREHEKVVQRHLAWIARCKADGGHPVYDYFSDGNKYFKECKL